MDTSNWVYLTAYVDDDIDRVIRSRAAGLDLSKGEMFRQLLVAGLGCVDAGAKLVRLCDKDRLHMRHVFLPPSLNSRVSQLGWDFHLKRTAVMRQLLRLAVEQAKPDRL